MDNNDNRPSELDDPNHWRVDLRGMVNGETAIGSYHLSAESQAEARYNALLKWGGQFDELPFITTVERYRTWRMWESQAEGPMGVQV